MLRNYGAKRLSHAIKQPSIARAFNGTNFASAKGLPLNLLVTFNFWQADCPLEDVAAKFAWIRDARFTPFMRRPLKRHALEGTPPTYIWCLENPTGLQVHGHWLIHAPSNRRELLIERLPLWFKEIVTGPLREDALHFQDVTNPVGMTKYMMKGADELWAKTYGIRAEDQGPIIGKRAGTSLNIGRTERARWVERGEIQPLRRLFHVTARQIETRP
ncbi:hypothetical protein [Aestuariivirga litoralis]|uniref:hypothetical protein n=1 Tax=Aestuariivirga litoralis TaxID=2650924 RepID=UPI0018C68BEF|nr:hypothetical protein [Aestuariivirga litoralis]MBG1233968.1 hypothetical protein [Aestuariivirga litoralis]